MKCLKLQALVAKIYLSLPDPAIEPVVYPPLSYESQGYRKNKAINLSCSSDFFLDALLAYKLCIY